MKKTLLILILFLSPLLVQAQVKLGVKISPGISFSRVNSDSDTLNFSSNGSGVRFILGVFVDIPFAENYYFSTGLSHASKRVGFEESVTGIDETYNLQYLQLPLTIKLFTNEIAIDTRIYFQLGALAEFKIAEKEKDNSNFFVDEFRTFDTSLMIGVGVERNVGTNTALIGGISYQRGLVNSVSEHQMIDQDLVIKNDIFTLDLAIKF